MQIEQLKPIIEAALLAASQPLTIAQLGELFVEEDEVDRAQIAMALEQLAEDCQARGVELKEVASGFRYQIRQDVHPWVSRMWTEKPSRYSRALLETLALIAYRQPITRPEIEQIRGVVVSSNIVKTLEEREWVRVVGHRDVPGKPALYGTTRAFLDYFNLKSLDELPPLSEIRDMEDPQMRLDNESAPPIPRAVHLPIDPDAEEAEGETLANGAQAEAEQLGEQHADAARTEEVHTEENQSHAGHVEAEEAHQTPIDEAPLDEAPAHPTPSRHQEETAHAPSPIDEPADQANTVDENETHPSTADEAANPADAPEGTVEQDTEEYRA
jgi:segregation and condensation protein B